MAQQAVEWLTIDEFWDHIERRFSRWHVEEMARQGELVSVKVGRRRLIRADALDLLAERQQAEERR